MKPNKTKILRESAMMIALTVVFVLASVYVPFLSVISSVICGIPIAALTARNGLKVTVPAMFVIFVVTVIVTGNILSAVSIVLMSVLPGAVAGYFLGQKKPFFTALLGTCIAVCVGWMFELLIINVFSGDGIDKMLSEMVTQIEDAVRLMIENISETDMLGEELSPDEMTALFTEMFEYTLRLYLPSFVVISSMILGYITMRVCAFVIKRAKIADVSVVLFSEMKAPRSMSLMAVAFYLVFIFLKQESVLWTVIANVVFILYTIMGVCGLSFVDYKFKTKIKSSAGRFAVYALVMLIGSAFMSMITNILLIIGILDSGRDFRKLGNAEL